MKPETSNLKRRDQRYIWHPLTQHKTAADAIPIVRAKGSVLYGENDEEYIDAIASWYTAMYGHCNDFIIDRVHEQMQKLDQIVFSGFTHEPAIELSEKLIAILPENQNKLFFNDNGSTATEIGIKMALQYHFNRGEKRKTMLALAGGFHGDTLGAMSVSSLSVYNGPFEEHFMDVKRIPLPNGKNHQEILEMIKNYHAKSPLAGFIYEPLVQGAAGMIMYNAQGLDQILELCESLNVIKVADEVMTGFGKTGKNFASEYMEQQPDVMCLSKALTAGMLPMGITSCSQRIYDAFYDDDMGKGLFHAHTYSANPLACAAAIASIELLTSEEIQTKIKTIEQWHREFDSTIKNHPKVKSTRQLGIIYVLELNIEMERYGNTRQKLVDYCMKRGVFMRPLGETLYITAPYTITQAEMEKIYAVIESLLEGF